MTLFLIHSSLNPFPFVNGLVSKLEFSRNSFYPSIHFQRFSRNVFGEEIFIDIKVLDFRQRSVYVKLPCEREFCAPVSPGANARFQLDAVAVARCRAYDPRESTFPCRVKEIP